jgi:hypothetical protein
VTRNEKKMKKANRKLAYVLTLCGRGPLMMSIGL